MSSVKDEITMEIGNLIGRAATAGSTSWEYAAYVFTSKMGGGSRTEFFVFSDGRREDVADDAVWAGAKESFSRLREITRVDGDEYWIKCLAVVQKSSLRLKLVFEFDNYSRWEITPHNARNSFEVITRDAFPEIFL